MTVKRKLLLCFLLGTISASITLVGAASLIYSKDVSYDNSKSGLNSNTVQGALDELYESAKNAPKCDSDGVCKVSCPSGKVFVSTDKGYKCTETTGNLILKNNDVVTSGDGLYKDTVTSGRYFYRGANPNNYITFNNETWRIISIESDGTLKIVRNERLSSRQQWDEAGNRNSSTSTYCTQSSSYGCDAWAATSNLINKPSNFTQYYPNGNTNDSTNYTGKVTKNSTMLTYLKGTYYNNLSNKAKTKVVKGTFNVSTPGNTSDTESLEIDASQEKQYQWEGYVALYTVTELLRASTNSNCTSLNAGYNSNNTGYCNSNNWLWPTFNTDGAEWTLSPYVSSARGIVWCVNSYGYVDYGNADGSSYIRPVLFLSNTITLLGTGSSTDPYQIK